MQKNCDFAPPPQPFLPPGLNELHLWCARLETHGHLLRACAGWLTPEERRRAARFVREPDRDLFTLARGMARELLGRCLDVAPGAVQFECNECGKPRLAAVSDHFAIRFNIAHSHGAALCGITSGVELGVDLERIRPDFATAAIAQRFFAPAEAAILSRLPETRQTRAFFECWTRKEAYLKARGLGLSLPLASFEVAFGPGASPAVLRATDDPGASRRWTLLPLEPWPDFVGAAVVEMTNPAVHLWEWQPRTDVP